MARVRLFTRSTFPGAEWTEHWGGLPRVPMPEEALLLGQGLLRRRLSAASSIEGLSRRSVILPGGALNQNDVRD